MSVEVKSKARILLEFKLTIVNFWMFLEIGGWGFRGTEQGQVDNE